MLKVPNWNRWLQMPEAYLWECIALSCNVEPLKTQHKRLLNELEYSEVARDNNLAVRLRERDAIATSWITANDFPPLRAKNWGNLVYSQVSLPEFAAWAIEKQWDVPPAFASIASATANTKRPRQADTLHARASRVGFSDKLMKMIHAAEKFWANANRDDRGTHPDNAQVAAWLTKQGFSATLASKAATILRPEWAPTGRKPEK